MMQEHAHGSEMTAEDAARFLGVELKALESLLERYGVGRHYEARHGEQFFYDVAELDKIERHLETLKAGAAL